MVRERRLAPKMSVTFGAGNSDIEEGAQRARNTIATRLVTHVRNLSHTPMLHALHSTSSPLRPLYSRSRDSVVRHRHRLD